MPAQHAAHFNYVPCRAGLCRDDGRFAPGQPVEQGRFSGIGRADNGDTKAIPDALANAAITQRRADLRNHAVQLCKDRGCRVLRRIAFIREINRHFDQCQHARQLGTPARIGLRQSAAELSERLRLLRASLCFNDVGHTFGLGQVQLAGLESAPRVLTRLGHAHALMGCDGAQ